MVNANVRESARGVTDALGERQLMAVVALAVLGAGGFVLAQEVVDIVHPMLNMSPDPTSGRGLGMAALTKLVAAALFVAVAARAGSTGKAVAGVLAFGMLSSMGADLFEMLQTSGVPGTSTSSSTSSSSTPSANVQRVQPQPAAATAGGSGRSPTNIDNGSYR